MATYKLVPTLARTVEADMESATAKLASSLAELEASVARFKAVNEGQAPDAYAHAQEQWNAAQIDMKNCLAVGRVRLAEIIAEYINGDYRGAGFFM